MKINNVTFTLIKKIWNGQYMLVQIQSVDEKINVFYVYPSNSELGVWRLCSYRDDYIYKGNTITSDDYTYDYVQSTLIHLQLQLYINEHIYSLPLEQMPIYPDYTLYKDIISSPSRQIHLSPFIDFQNIIQCGELNSPHESNIRKMFGNIPNYPSTLIAAFANQLEEQYSIDFSSITIEGPYSNMFQYVIQIEGVVKSIILFNRDQKVKLYFLELQFIEKIDPRINDKLTPEMKTNIHTLCAIPVHFMPFLLTLPDATCNEFGLYTTYIPCGSFICKLFDYSSEKFVQCSKQEMVCGQVTPLYSYIGSRYNIFPFVSLMEKSMSPKIQHLNKSIRHIQKHHGGKQKTNKKQTKTFKTNAAVNDFSTKQYFV